MAPIDINNQDINSITLNGSTEIDTVTVNGQEVFSSNILPVAYSNLVAWYPFDASTYGGSNADDVTAIIGGSGDDTAYDGSVTSASYQSSNGVTDINAGTNSGAYDFDGSNDYIIVDNVSTTGISQPDRYGQISFGCWISVDSGNYILSSGSQTGSEGFQMNNAGGTSIRTGNRDFVLNKFWSNTSTYQHVFITWDGNTMRAYLDGVNVSSTSGELSSQPEKDENLFTIGTPNNSIGNYEFNGRIDDVRIYNRSLSTSEVNQIYQNTNP